MLKFCFNKSHQIVDGIQIVWNELAILNLDVKFLFEKYDQFQNAGGIDDPFVQEGVVVAQVTVALAKEKVVNDKLPQFLLDVPHKKKSLQSF